MHAVDRILFGVVLVAVEVAGSALIFCDEVVQKVPIASHVRGQMLDRFLGPVDDFDGRPLTL